jgi:hypothetical protein
VTAEFAGKPVRKSVTLGDRRQLSVHFYWPGGDAPVTQ